MQTTIILTVEETARILKFASQKVRTLLKTGKLKGIRYSRFGDWRILSTDLEKFITQYANRKTWQKPKNK